MTNTRDVILKLKEVKNEKNLSIGKILELMEKNGDYLSKSTVARVFTDGSESKSFMYEETIRPIAKALLDMETIDDDDTMDIRALKSLLKYKIERIEDLEKQIEKLEAEQEAYRVKARDKLLEEREKFREKLDEEREHFDKERAAWRNNVELLNNQVAKKDDRMDFFLEALKDKDEMLKETLLRCPCKHAQDCPKNN